MLTPPVVPPNLPTVAPISGPVTAPETAPTITPATIPTSVKVSAPIDAPKHTPVTTPHIAPVSALLATIPLRRMHHSEIKSSTIRLKVKFRPRHGLTPRPPLLKASWAERSEAESKDRG